MQDYLLINPSLSANKLRVKLAKKLTEPLNSVLTPDLGELTRVPLVLVENS